MRSPQADCSKKGPAVDDLTEKQRAMLIEAARGQYLKVIDMATQIGSNPLGYENEKAGFNLALRGLLTRHPELEERGHSGPSVSVWQITPEGLALVDAMKTNS